MKRLDAASEWIPRLVYFAILVFVGYQIIEFYIGRMKDVQNLLKD
jgi:hypothetical protein